MRERENAREQERERCYLYVLQVLFLPDLPWNLMATGGGGGDVSSDYSFFLFDQRFNPEQEKCSVQNSHLNRKSHCFERLLFLDKKDKQQTI